MKHQISYACDKCRNTSYDEGNIRVAGGFWTRIFNVQNRKFTFVACTKCGYTEFYKSDNSGALANIVDLLTT